MEEEMAIAENRQVVHPLDPLTAQEIEQAVALVQAEGRLSDRARFATVALAEPAKPDVLAFAPGDPVRRRVELVVLDKAQRTTFEILVSVTDRRILEWRTAQDGGQPPVLPEEWDLAEDIAKADPGFIEACRRRGVTDLEYVFLDPVSAGNFGLKDEDGRRLVRAVSYWRRDGRDNGYAYPIGVVPVVDLYEERVISILEGPEVPLPPRHGRFDVESQSGSLRKDLRDLQIVQPRGVSFEVTGNLIEWQKWSLRVSMHPRVGLVLHTVSYAGRPVMYRAALSEMVVPYGDPTDEHFFKAVFDAGEYGLGQMANSLELGCDCLGEISYIDATLCDQRGEPMTIRNAICVHEEDSGILWKHFDARSDETEVRRNRRLVISYICTVGNYDYGFYWYLYQDGTIELETKATGIMQTQALPEGELPEWGELVAPRLGAMHHQHFFNFRLDMMVDGPRNSVYEVNSEYRPLDEHNRHGSAMRPEVTLLGRESQARRDVNTGSNRYWKVVSAGGRNALGTPTAYKLIPGHNSTLLAHPESAMAKRAGFAQHHLWVTRYDADQRYAAGDYPNQSDPEAAPHGIPRFQQADRSLKDEDVVLWYTFGATHFPRPEDWPVMPVEPMGFVLKPHGFFAANPALDVPPPDGHCAQVDHASHAEGHRQGGAQAHEAG
jgi:primary-amine oxidase